MICVFSSGRRLPTFGSSNTSQKYGWKFSTLSAFYACKGALVVTMMERSLRETYSGKDNLFCAPIFVLYRPSYRQAFRGGTYPVPRIHDHTFCDGVGGPGCRSLLGWGGVIAGLFCVSVGRAKTVCYRGECTRMEGKYVGCFGGPCEGQHR